MRSQLFISSVAAFGLVVLMLCVTVVQDQSPAMAAIGPTPDVVTPIQGSKSPIPTTPPQHLRNKQSRVTSSASEAFTSTNWLQPATDSINVYIAGAEKYVDNTARMEVVDASNPYSLQLLGANDFLVRYPRRIYVSGNQMFVANSGTLQIFNIQMPSNPQLASTFPTQAYDVVTNGTHAYVAAGSDGVRVIDVSNPANPILIKTYSGVDAEGIVMVGNYAYIASGNQGLRIIDIANANMLTTAVPTYGAARSLSANSHYVYVLSNGSSFTSKMTVIDIANPSSPIAVGTWTAPGFFGPYPRVDAVGSYAYVVGGDGGTSNLLIVDVSNPASPHDVGEFWSGVTYDVRVVGKYAYITTAAVQVIDISVPTLPQLVSVYSPGASSVFAVTAIFVQNSGSGGVDLAVMPPIEATNVISPYLPNNVTLQAVVRNNSAIVDATNVWVDFWDGNPDANGYFIGTTAYAYIHPGTSITASVNWWLNANIENHRVYVRVSASTSDPDSSNNTISRPISIYFTDFRHDIDAYSFSNYSMTHQLGYSDLRDLLSKLFDPGDILFQPMFPWLAISAILPGYCYGMADSSLVYKAHPELKPNSENVFSYTLEVANAGIRTYQTYMLGPSLKALMGSINYDPNTQYQQTLNNIKQGQPVLHDLVWLKPVGIEMHSVVAYKIIDLGDEKRVFYYDNNKPLKLFTPGEEETYGVFTPSGFSIPYYQSSAWQHPKFFNRAILAQPQLSKADDIRSTIYDFALWIMRYQATNGLLSISTIGNVDLIATDPLGNRTGYISGQQYTEIPGTMATSLSGMQSLLLPISNNYQFHIAAQSPVASLTTATPIAATGTYSLSIVDPLSVNSTRVIQFNNVTVSPSGTASLQFSHLQQNPQLSLPDGTLHQVDSVQTLNAYRSYLPIVGSGTSVINNQPPFTPSNPIPSNGTTDQNVNVGLYWNGGDPDDAVTYDVFFAANNSSPTTLVCSQISSIYCNPGTLGYSTHYFWKVVATDSHGAITNGPVWDFTTMSQNQLPAAPDGLTATAIDSSRIRLNWNDNSSNESGFVILDGNIWVTTTVANTTSYVVNGLAPNSYHCFLVYAYNSYGSSAVTNWGCTTTGAAPPGAFAKTAPLDGATDQPETGVTMSWQASSGAANYETCLSTSSVTCLNNAGFTQSSTVTSLSSGALLTGTTYYWHVRARNASGVTYSENSSSAQRSFTVRALPGAFSKSSPSNGASGIAAMSVNLSWEASAGADSYNVCLSTSLSTSTCTDAASFTVTTTNLNYTYGGLTPGISYYWHVRANNASGFTYSDNGLGKSWNFTTLPLPPAFNKLSPQNGAINQPFSGVTLSWQPAPGASNYRICMSTTAASCQSWGGYNIITTSTNYTTGSLQPGTIYYWHVQAINGSGSTFADGAFMAPWSFTTQPLTNGTPCNAVIAAQQTNYQSSQNRPDNYYALDVNVTSTVFMTLTNFSGSGVLLFHSPISGACPNVSTTPIVSQPVQGGVANISYFNVTPGRYYADIQSVTEDNNVYSFQWTASPGYTFLEPNNSPCTPYDVVPGELYIAYPENSRPDLGSENDLYRFTIGVTNSLSITFANYVAGPRQVQILSQNGTCTNNTSLGLLAYVSSGTFSMTLQPNVYQIRFFTLSGANSIYPYSFRISSATCPRKTDGDANCDGAINTFDYSIWLNSQCVPGPGGICGSYQADFNFDGRVDDFDYQIWLAHYGT